MEDGVGSFLEDDDDDGNKEDAGIVVAPAVHGVGLTRLRCTALARAAAGFDVFLFLLFLSSAAVVPANRRGTVRVRDDVRGGGSTIVLMATKRWCLVQYNSSVSSFNNNDNNKNHKIGSMVIV